MLKLIVVALLTAGLIGVGLHEHSRRQAPRPMPAAAARGLTAWWYRMPFRAPSPTVWVFLTPRQKARMDAMDAAGEFSPYAGPSFADVHPVIDRDESDADRQAWMMKRATQIVPQDSVAFGPQ